MIKTFYFNDLRTCCYIISDSTNECVIVDPGAYSDSEKSRLVKYIEENGLKPVKVINTHGHFDHVMAVRFVREKWGVPHYLNEGDKDAYFRIKEYCEYFGYQIESPLMDLHTINDGDELTYGNTFLKAYTVPGHSQGGVILYNEQDGYVLTGDSLFDESIGRTDLPGGDYETLITSIKEKILTLPDTTVVYPGHGIATSVEKEKTTNPYLK